MNATPTAPPPSAEALLAVRDLHTWFRLPRRRMTGRSALRKAVDGVSLTLFASRTLGLVGESGCGKTTLSRTILGLQRPTSGDVLFCGNSIVGLSARAMKPVRRHMQVVFQDPLGSLNPRMTVGRLLVEPLAVHGLGQPAERVSRALALLDRVGLDASAMNRYAHEFSGGQRQRICIARALILSPRLVICDEPVSALDVTVQAQILALLRALQQELGLAYLFISHDLAVIRQISDHVAVMLEGKIVEQAPVTRLFQAPQHPYTRRLLAAVPAYHAHRSRPR